MSKKYMYLFGAALLALSGVGASAQSVNAKATHHARTNVTRNYKQYFVNAPQSISSHARYIRGNASRGVRITLQNGKKTVASTYANRKTGRYTLRIPKRFAVGTQLKVMAQKGYAHPYKIVLVKTPANQKAAVRTDKKASHKVARKSVKKPVKRQTKQHVAKKATKRTKKVTDQTAKQATVKRNAKRNVKRGRKVANKKVNRKAQANKVTVKTPNGNWQTRASKRGYVQKWNLSQKRGVNESLYHNGRFVKKLVTNAPYKVNDVKNNVWTISYQGHGQKKTQKMTMRFLTNNHFGLTSQNGRRSNLSFLRY